MVITIDADELPQSVHDIVRKETLANKDDIAKALKRSIAAITKLPDYKTFLHLLVRLAIKSLVYDVRHEENRKIRKDRGEYGGPAKVIAGEATAKIARAAYDYMIAGITLGNVLGEDLEGIGDSEAAKADGHSFNAKLCRQLQPLVAQKKTVRQCVKESKLQKMFDDLG